MRRSSEVELEVPEKKNGSGSEELAPKSPWHIAFGERVRQAIKDGGFTGTKPAARAAGLAEMTVYRWVNGVALPRPAELERLAKTVGKPFAWFYDLRDEMVNRAEIEQRIHHLAAQQASEVMKALLIEVVKGADLAESWTRHSGAAEVMGERELAPYSAASDLIRQGVIQRFPDFEQRSPSQQRRALQTLLNELSRQE
jgi:transcriptional regulator with XRE-family HTH domain